ncbi:MAG: hypothetical protein CMH52_07795 [Myxococcales bacterium]|nr:hypothetical protein [Myxococcales bacterium]
MSNFNTPRTGTRRAVPSSSGLHFSVASSVVAEILSFASPSQVKQGLNDVISTRVEIPQPRSSMGITGSVVMQPADSQLQAKEIPVEQFLGKAMSIRDNCRVLEQKLNSSDKLSPMRLFALQGQLTRIQAVVLNFFCGFASSRSYQSDTEEVVTMLDDLSRAVDWHNLKVTAPALGERWVGGHVIYGEAGSYSESMEEFFRRMAIMRDELLSLDASIQDNRNFTEAETAKLTSYIRRSFGSLTTFNVLFQDRADYFSSK